MPAAQGRANAFDQRQTHIVHEQGVQPGVVDDEREFRSREAKIDRYKNGADGGGGIHALDEGGVIGTQKTNPVSAVHAGAAQGTCEQPDAGTELCIVEGSALEGERGQRGRERTTAQDVGAKADIGLRAVWHRRAPVAGAGRPDVRTRIRRGS